MANAVVAAGEEEVAAAPKKGPSLIIQIAVLLALTGAAAGAGLLAAGMLKDDGAPAHAAAGGHDGKAGHDVADPAAEDAKRGIVNLPLVMTNLAAPTGTWVRLEMAAVFEGQPEPAITDDIHQDLLAYLRTVKLHQIEGASGFQHLKSDLEERARVRSGGKVKKLLVRTLLFE